MGMKLVAEGTIFSGLAGTVTASCCFPSIVILATGTLLVSWRVGTTKESADGKILLAQSEDGCHWKCWPLSVDAQLESKTGEFHYGPLTCLADGRLLISMMWTDRSNPSLSFFNPQTEGLLPIRTIFAESCDGGLTWNQVRAMDTEPYRTPMPITGAVLELSDGRLACLFEVNKNYSDPRPWRHAAAMKISSDGGKSWPEAHEVANDPTGRLMYWDQRHSLQDNRWVAMFWTYDRESGCDAHIHISQSHDGGRIWTRPRDTGIAGQIAQPVLLKDGRLIVIYIDRFHTRSIRAKVSFDLGMTFSQEDLLVYLHHAGSNDPGQQSESKAYLQDQQLWTFGRVDAAVDSTGDIWVVFYCGTTTTTEIHWARIRV